jgi:hypothetical protein
MGLSRRRWCILSLCFVDRQKTLGVIFFPGRGSACLQIQWVVRPKATIGFCWVSFGRRRWQIWCLLSCLNPLGFY